MATIVDVAQAAGVSVATVSRVLNGKGHVKPELRERVDRAVEALSYVPNSAARNLRRSESGTVLILAPNLTNPYYTHILAGIGEVAQSCGYRSFLCNTGGDIGQIQSLLSMLETHEADGAILLATELGAQWLAPYAQSYPIVQSSEFDPEVDVRPVDGQIDDLLSEINLRTARGERVLITTLTKKMAEDLTSYLDDMGVKVRYMHHDIDTIERMEIIRDLRSGEFDVLVGINLLREGLDIPEVSLVAILDADKEGFLRSETSLIQTIGRAARNASGKVIMYADSVTPSMERAIFETQRRREIQQRYNDEHGIVPKTIVKGIRDVIDISAKDEDGKKRSGKAKTKKLGAREREELIRKLTVEMKNAAKILEFEHAAYLRDKIKKLMEER